MRISDWSSDVCSSDLPDHVPAELVHDFDIYNDDQIKRDLHAAYARLHREAPPVFYTPANGGHWLITRHDLMSEVVRDFETFSARESQIPRVENAPLLKIGRASCRERVCQYV